MSNKEITPECSTDYKDQIKRLACSFFYWCFNTTNGNIEQSFDQWAELNADRLFSFERGIRRDQHEKSCRAQRGKCMKCAKIITQRDYLPSKDVWQEHSEIDKNSILNAHLADFNDTITE